MQKKTNVTQDVTQDAPTGRMVSSWTWNIYSELSKYGSILAVRICYKIVISLARIIGSVRIVPDLIFSCENLVYFNFSYTYFLLEVGYSDGVL